MLHFLEWDPLITLEDGTLCSPVFGRFAWQSEDTHSDVNAPQASQSLKQATSGGARTGEKRLRNGSSLRHVAVWGMLGTGRIVCDSLLRTGWAVEVRRESRAVARLARVKATTAWFRKQQGCLLVCPALSRLSEARSHAVHAYLGPRLATHMPGVGGGPCMWRGGWRNRHVWGVNWCSLGMGKSQRLVSTLSRLWATLGGRTLCWGRKQGEEDSPPKCLWPSVIWGGQGDADSQGPQFGSPDR